MTFFVEKGEKIDFSRGGIVVLVVKMGWKLQDRVILKVVGDGPERHICATRFSLRVADPQLVGDIIANKEGILKILTFLSQYG